MSKLAYFTDFFPTLSTTFIQREVRELSALGLNPVLTSNRSMAAGDYHPQDRDLVDRTYYLRTVNPFRPLFAGLKFMARHPLRFFQGLCQVWALDDDFPWQRLRNLLHLTEAMVLADYLLQKGVIHLHVHFAFGAAGVALFHQILTGMPYSLSIHGSDVLLPEPLTEEKLKSAAFIVSNCEFHVNDLKKRYFSLYNQRFHVIRLGLDIRSRLWAQPKPQAPGDVLRILNVARLHPVKAQDILIRACSRLKHNRVGIHCRIVGDGPRREELETMVTELDLKDEVELLGPKYEAEVSELYDWADVFVLSSLSEGTPMTVIEAMAKARPVVVPRMTALPEMVIDGRTGLLFQPGSAEDLAGKLTLLSEKSFCINEMGGEGRRRAEALFDLHANMEELLDVFRREALFPGEDEASGGKL